MDKDAKIYVAGHRGLVGSAIIGHLKANNFCRLITKTHSELDLTDTLAVKGFFETEKPEYVFLAAAKVGGIVANSTCRAEFIYENLMIQNNVVHQSYIYGVKKLMFLGSTCIYPKKCPQPIKEEFLLTDVLEYTNEPYAIAKIAGIKLCESYNLQYGTNFISVMPTNLYGPHDNFNLETSHVMPALIRKIHLGKALETKNWNTVRCDLNYLPIDGISGNEDQNCLKEILEKYGIWISNEGKITVEIWGSGKPMREFLWSEDTADACLFLMQNTEFKEIYNNSSNRNSHINIGTGQDISILNLAKLIKDIVGYRGDFTFNTSKPDGTLKKVTDVTRLHELGWQHKTTLEEGIKKLYKWYLEQV